MARRVLVIGAIVLSATQATAQVVTSGSGPAAITARDSFRAILGGGTTAGSNGSFGVLRREINWDGVPAPVAAPNPLPPDFFKTTSPRGVVLSTPGSALEVSGATSDSGAGQPAAPNFGNINPSYTGTFTAFSPQRLFTAINSNVVDVTFFVPNTSTPALTNGFGAMFVDVDNAGTTTLEFFDASGTAIGSPLAVPPAAGGAFSFLGASFGAPVVSRVRITAGNAPLGPDDNPPAVDVVAMDDFIYGEPVSATCTLTCPLDISRGNDVDQCGATVTYAPSLSGACGAVTLSPPSGSFLPIGTTAVSAQEAGGQSCQFNVTVSDTQQPAITCPADITTPATSAAGAIVNFNMPAASDNCTALPVVNCDAVSGSQFPAGRTLVTCTATDEASNIGSCAFAINVTPLPPAIGKTFAEPIAEINTPVSLSFTLYNPNDSASLTGIAFTDALPVDMYPLSAPATACGGAVSIDQNLGKISLDGGLLGPKISCEFSVDVQSLTAGDKHNTTSNVTSNESGAGSTASADITVIDTCVLTCPADITVTNDPSQCGAIVNYTAPTFVGACGTITSTPPSGSFFPVGKTTVTSTSDAGPVCSFTVTVLDSEPPIVTCPQDITTPATSPSGAVVTFDSPVAIDNCAAGIAMNCDAVSGATFPVGTTTVTCTTTDVGLNTTSCAFHIRVTGEPPTISKSFGRTTAGAGSVVSLSFTLGNPNTSGSLSGIAFTDALPAGMSAVDGPPTACGGTVAIDPKTGAIAFAGGTLQAGDSCTFTVDVQAFLLGLQHNETSHVTSNESAAGAIATANITIISAPGFSMAFEAPSIPTLGPEVAINSSTSLEFTISNPNADVALTGVGFADTLPSGLIVSTPNALVGSCGGTITAAAGSSTIALTGGTLAANAVCSFSVDVTATTLGMKTNMTGPITSAETGGGNTADASIRVLAAGPATVTATATGSSSVTISWSAVAGAAAYAVGRSSAGNFKAITFLGITTSTSFPDNGVTGGNSYLYVVAWAPSSGAPPTTYSAPSFDVATTIAFTDGTLTPKVTPPKVLHFDELLLAINAVRTLAQLNPFTYGETLTSGVTNVKADHLNAARNALAEARARMHLPPNSYTQPVVTAGSTIIRTADVQEVRNGVNPVK